MSVTLTLVGLASRALARFYSSNLAAPHRTRLKVERDLATEAALAIEDKASALTHPMAQISNVRLLVEVAK